MEFENYSKAIDFLYNRNEFAIKLGLKNIDKFLAAKNFLKSDLPVIHIAGTNGKGSVCYQLSKWLPKVGYNRVGLFSSPHLVSFRERIKVNHDPIKKNWVRDWLSANHQTIESMGLTYFECVTAMALEYFKENNCDMVLLETGLGGRLDATNWIHPLITVVTSISRDHSSILGNELADILKEKLGILKSNIPLVIADQKSELKSITLEKARELNCQVTFESDLNWESPEWEKNENLIVTWNENKISISTSKNLSPHLKSNLSLALLALFQLPNFNQKKINQLDMDIPPIRQQVIIEPKFPNLILDVAHNEEGIRSLKDFVGNQKENFFNILVFAFMADKEINQMMSLLVTIPHVKAYFVELSNPRALAGEEIPESFVKQLNNLEIVKPNQFMLEIFPELPAKSRLIILGSFYLLGNLLPDLGKKYNELKNYSDLRLEDEINP